MKVILLQDIKRFGTKGSVQNVATGYAQSYLIPRGLARVASDGDVEHAQHAQEEKQKKTKELEGEDLRQFKSFNQKKIEIQANASQSGKLFSSINSADISAKLPGLKPEHLLLKKGVKEVGQSRIPYQVGKLKGYITLVVVR